LSGRRPEPGPYLADSNQYVDIKGRALSLNDLDRAERALVKDLIRKYESGMGWNEFDNYWFAKVGRFYDQRGVPREESRNTAVFRIAQDLSSRNGIRSGYVRMPDYRDELAVMIQRRFKSRREFCKQTGISEDMLSHVLARRKHLSIETLTDALAKIGYSLQIMPMEPAAAPKG